MTITHPNILLIAGTGRNSGKTSLVCKIIERFSDRGIIAVKISPHFHLGARGLERIRNGNGFNIYLEIHKNTGKDSARMLQAGADKVFYLEVLDKDLENAFMEFIKMIPRSSPMVCESPALRKVIRPGVFLIVDHPETLNKKKDVLDWRNKADIFADTSVIELEDLADHITLDEEGWTYHS